MRAAWYKRQLRITVNLEFSEKTLSFQAKLSGLRTGAQTEVLWDHRPRVRVAGVRVRGSNCFPNFSVSSSPWIVCNSETSNKYNFKASFGIIFIIFKGKTNSNRVNIHYEQILTRILMVCKCEQIHVYWWYVSVRYSTVCHIFKRQQFSLMIFCTCSK